MVFRWDRSWMKFMTYFNDTPQIDRSQWSFGRHKHSKFEREESVFVKFFYPKTFPRCSRPMSVWSKIFLRNDPLSIRHRQHRLSNREIHLANRNTGSLDWPISFSSENLCLSDDRRIFVVMLQQSPIALLSPPPTIALVRWKKPLLYKDNPVHRIPPTLQPPQVNKSSSSSRRIVLFLCADQPRSSSSSNNNAFRPPLRLAPASPLFRNRFK